MKLFEIISDNKFGYTKLQYAMIKLWGGILYIDYDLLPSGPGDIDALSKDIDEYLSAEGDELEQFEEWFQEGAKKNGKALLTKSAFDKVMKSCERVIDEELTVYKFGTKSHSGDRWISTTTKNEGYSHQGAKTVYKLPIGTKVIFADGIADDKEIIINTSELPK